MAERTDMYTQIAYMAVTQSAANTITWDQLGLRLGTGKREAWVIEQIEWIIAKASLRELQANTDNIDVGLSMSDNLTAMDQSDQALITSMTLVAVGAQVEPFREPFIQDFTHLGGSGLLVLPSPLFIGVASSGMAAAVTTSCRIRYRSVELQGNDYVELVEAARIQS